MRFQISNTAYSSKRLWLETSPCYSEQEFALFIILNRLCIWGGKDKAGKNYSSWEFDPKMEPAVRRLLEFDKYQDDMFDMDDTSLDSYLR